MISSLIMNYNKMHKYIFFFIMAIHFPTEILGCMQGRRRWFEYSVATHVYIKVRQAPILALTYFPGKCTKIRGAVLGNLRPGNLFET